MGSYLKLQSDLRERLESLHDPVRAVQMQRYMKSALPYYGIRAGPLRAVVREVFKGYAPESLELWQADVLALWHGASHREERYAALALCAHRGARRFQRYEAMPLYEELIVTGAWWDLVDEVASARLPVLLTADRGPMTEALRAWSKDANLWKRRASIISQLKLNNTIDLDLLYSCIEPSLDSSEFFLCKAIGWALRQYARKDPQEVIRYVQANATRLSGLSKREALRHLPG